MSSHKRNLKKNTNHLKQNENHQIKICRFLGFFRPETQFYNRRFIKDNGTSPHRNRFFKLLSEYKRVDSGGRYMNNIGGPVPDKEIFIKNYKFNIAFENSMYDGYTTEKILEPMLVNSLPIYWGNKLVGADFNPQSFINASDFSSLEAAVEYVVRVDQNDEEYLSILSTPWLNKENYLNWENRVYDFFDNIFSKPITEARRLADYGRVKIYRKRLNLYSSLDVMKRKLRDLHHKIK
ncbi:glycosyltransferase family 10 domain-containing protein [Bacteroides sp.]